MPKAPPSEPFFMLTARHLGRLAKQAGELRGLAQEPAPEAAQEAAEFFSRMVGFSPEPEGQRNAAGESPAAASPAASASAP